MDGTVKRVIADKGFGFITGEDGVDRFVHYSEVRGCKLEELTTGDAVTFTPEEGTKGPRAAEVYRA